MLFSGVAFLAGGDQVAFGAPAPADNRDNMIHRQGAG